VYSVMTLVTLRRARTLAHPRDGKPDLVNRLVLDLLEKDPVPTYRPLRRAPASANHEH
jgi:hypothetical protein